jgi:hypothetical protein
MDEPIAAPSLLGIAGEGFEALGELFLLPGVLLVLVSCAGAGQADESADAPLGKSFLDQVGEDGLLLGGRQ